MKTLRESVDEKASPNQKASFLAEDWCKANTGWVRVCDIPSDEFQARILLAWEDIGGNERRQWISRYPSEHEAIRAWEEFGRQGRYKVVDGFIMDDGSFVTVNQWRSMNLRGRGFMQVFKLH